MNAVRSSRLDRIVAMRRDDVAALKAIFPQDRVKAAAQTAPLPPDFVNALRGENRAGQSGPALIAEIKRASPSKGDLALGLDPVELTRTYRENGAAAVSVLTESRHFRGSLDDLRQVTMVQPTLPALRKDFIFDEYQVYEARAAGASAILLIAACLEDVQLRALYDLAGELGMAALIEVHAEDELDAVLACRPALVGINNRNLHDFSVSLDTTLRLRPLIPAEVIVVAESGIHTAEDVRYLGEAGVDAVLVGEALVTAGDVAEKVRSLAWLS